MNTKILYIVTLLAASLFLFNACNYTGQELSEDEKSYYNDLGANSVDSLSKILMKNLMNAMADSGIKSAVPYCKMNADSLVASLNMNDGIKSIRRTTLKPRNKANKATERDKNIFKIYEYAQKRKDPLKPILQTDPKQHEVRYYSPIHIKTTCLPCHGNRTNGYTRENFDLINNLYPKDKAFNYSIDEMRGMWVVTMEERK